jgi:DNA-binding MarR family transcriptional regulator
VKKESALQQEIQQTLPFRSRAQEGAVGLLRTADLVRRSLAGIVEPHGITTQQYNVLRILRGAGEQGIPTLDIVERMLEQAPGLTRLLDRLETKKLVRRKRCPSDRRQVLCWITPAGLKLLGRLDEPLLRTDGAVLGDLSQRDLRTLIRILDRVRAGQRP